MKRLWEIFEERVGSLSMMRALSFLTVVVPLFVWALISIGSWVVLPMPESIVVLLIAGLTGKVAQKYVEGKEEKAGMLETQDQTHANQGQGQ